MQGWIKLHRCITSHWVWDNPQYLKCWLDILMQAGHTSRKILVNGNIREIPVGEFLTSEVKLAQRWQLNRKTVSNILKLFEKDGMIVLAKSRQEGTWIKVANYTQYQHENPEVSDMETDMKTDMEQDIQEDIDGDNIVYINNNLKKEKSKELNKSIPTAAEEDLWKSEKQECLKRYDSDQLQLIHQAMAIFQDHHKPLTKEKELQMYREWALQPVERVLCGLNKYIHTPSIHEKNENYILGIMKNVSYAEIYVMMRSTGM